MPRDWIDSTYDEADLLPRYTFLDRNGQPLLQDGKAVVSSPVVQEGDRVGAAFFNLVSEIDDDGLTPLLAIDGGTVEDNAGWQTILRQGGGAIPTSLLPGQLFAADNGDVYIGNSAGTPVLLGKKADIDQVQANLSVHASRTDNPHKVSRAQLGAAAATDLTSHVNARNNPHQVTKAQVGLGNVNNVAALPLTGGTLSSPGNLTMGPTLILNNAQAGRSAKIETSGDSTTFYTSSMTGLSVMGNGTSAYVPVLASAFTVSSDRELKEDIVEVDAGVVDSFLGVKSHQYRMGGKTTFGYVADELGEVSDKLVVQMDKETQGIDLYALVAVQGEAIRTLNEKIDELTKQLEEK